MRSHAPRQHIERRRPGERVSHRPGAAGHSTCHPGVHAGNSVPRVPAQPPPDGCVLRCARNTVVQRSGPCQIQQLVRAPQGTVAPIPRFLVGCLAGAPRRPLAPRRLLQGCHRHGITGRVIPADRSNHAQETLPLPPFDIPLGLRGRPVGGRGDAVARPARVVFGSAQRPPDILSVMAPSLRAHPDPDGEDGVLHGGRVIIVEFAHTGIVRDLDHPGCLRACPGTRAEHEPRAALGGRSVGWARFYSPAARTSGSRPANW